VNDIVPVGFVQRTEDGDCDVRRLSHGRAPFC
jgi:hypothetical protein